jgi:hypothetical protein
MWCLYSIEFYSATKKNEILSLPGKWMKLENIILSEVCQVQKNKSHREGPNSEWGEGPHPSTLLSKGTLGMIKTLFPSWY